MKKSNYTQMLASIQTTLGDQVDDQEDTAMPKND